MHTKGVLCVFLLIAVLAALLVPGAVSAQSYTDISVEEAWDMINVCCDEVVLDVRTQEEYDEAHIEGAVLIPVTELSGRLGELEADKPTIVYCKAGTRSAQASQILVDSGFTDVYNMLGGLDAWEAASYPTTGSSSGGGCFIASAAFGSHLDGQVTVLRDLRDARLTSCPIGSALASAYYMGSPHAAGFIDDHPAVKPFVRTALLPAIGVSEAAVGLTVSHKIATAAALLLATSLVGYWVACRRARPSLRA